MTTKSTSSKQRARVCPRCGGRSISRSRTRTVLDAVARTLGLRAYRCLDCWHRFTGLPLFS